MLRHLTNRTRDCNARGLATRPGSGETRRGVTSGGAGPRMAYDELDRFLAGARGGAGPVALILAEDGIELASTIRHHSRIGFDRIAVLAPGHVAPARGPGTDAAAHLRFDARAPGAAARAVNRAIAALPGRWIYWGYNAEYLFFPFCEHRAIAEALAFVAEERRESVHACVVDLYAGDPADHPSGVSVEDACLDLSGYYALARKGPDGAPLERQLDFFGGLRWRFEEHVPPDRRAIGRVALFRARPGLAMDEAGRFSDPEFDTYECPWHHSLSAAVCSFRAAKALRANPGSAAAARDFRWRNSGRFDWRSQQLMDLGLMEPGQWF